MMSARRDRVAAASAFFRPKGKVSDPAAPLVPPSSRPTLSLKLEASVASPAMPSAEPPAAVRTAKMEAAAPALLAEARRASETPTATAAIPKGDTPPKSYDIAELRALVDWMRETWPAAFPDPPRPLAIGAGALIAKARPPGRSHKDIGAAVRFYVNSDTYLEAVRDGVRRIHLDGSDGGEVTEEHRLHARKQLEQRQAGRRDQRAQQVSTEDRHG
jgi:ProP effector